MCFGARRAVLLSGTVVAEIVASSGGQLLPIQQLLYVTVGGTHLNFWLRALNKNCTTNEKAIATPSGRLDTATLFAHQPDLRDAVNDGLARVTLDSSLLAVEGLAEYIQNPTKNVDKLEGLRFIVDAENPQQMAFQLFHSRGWNSWEHRRT